MESAAPSADPRAQRSVDRAVGELRRGLPVLVLAGGDTVLALATEQLSDASLSRLRDLGAEPPLLALTARRAGFLHIRPTGHDVVRVEISGHMDAGLLQGLADPANDLGHPLRGPFRERKGAPGAGVSAAIKLAKLARLLPSVVVCPPRDKAARVAADDDLVQVEAAAIENYDAAAANDLVQVAAASLPLRAAEDCRILAFRPHQGGVEHLALVIGRPDTGSPVLVRLHSECFTGDLLGSLKCDCGDQLQGALNAIAEAGGGVLLYLAQEGRGIGLINKLRAYHLQDQGLDTIDANERLGFDADERLFAPAASMLRQLGFDRVRLLSNNPDKVAGLEACGVEVVERVAHSFPANAHNERYLATKRKRSGHYL